MQMHAENLCKSMLQVQLKQVINEKIYNARNFERKYGHILIIRNATCCPLFQIFSPYLNLAHVKFQGTEIYCSLFWEVRICDVSE